MLIHILYNTIDCTIDTIYLGFLDISGKNHRSQIFHLEALHVASPLRPQFAATIAASGAIVGTDDQADRA